MNVNLTFISLVTFYWNISIFNQSLSLEYVFHAQSIFQMFVVLIRKKLCIPKVRLLRRIHHTSIHNNFHKQFLDEQKCRPVRRALLYVPGHDLKKIKKLSRVKVDCAVLDCEDGVDFKK